MIELVTPRLHPLLPADSPLAMHCLYRLEARDYQIAAQAGCAPAPQISAAERERSKIIPSLTTQGLLLSKAP